MGYGPDCSPAIAEFFACRNMLTCEEYDSVIPSFCDDELNALDAVCIPENISPLCQALGARYTECEIMVEDPPEVNCQLEINNGTEDFGEACGQATEDYFACLTALDCADLESEQGCAKEITTMNMLCQ
ncbi:MAG TPA: hypothetical protein ENJ18_04920 [Nannocystis exedens]|nr:hypothetical protein [Nannocystis exedens]